MTRTENLEKITKACQKANPEIMELKFGCEILFKSIPFILVGENYAGNTIAYADFGKQTKIIDQMKIDKILGREIQLADVILIIGKKGHYNMDYNCHEGNIFLIMGDGTHPRAEWNLHLPLSRQSDETFQFLSDLL